jgi:ABC-type lipoprotein export system ATPase subunit
MAALLSMSGVCVAHGRQDRRTEVLRDVSLTVAAGEVVAVVGSPNAGRTTLLNVASGLRPAAVSGEVQFDGIDLMRLSQNKLIRLWGERILRLDREPPLFPSQVYRHIVVYLFMHRRYRVPEAERLAWKALDQMGVAGCGLRHWDTLSTWERLLVNFAAATAVRPQLILVDDLFDGLGSRRTHEASQLLRSIVGEISCGVLLSVADPESALGADRVWGLHEGRLTDISDERAAPLNTIALAGELYTRGYKDAAAMITGSALEQHLRELAMQGKILIERSAGLPPGGESLNHALVASGIYNRLQQKSVTAWLDLRNKAAHGHYSTYDAEQVLGLIRDVRDFMKRFPT